MTFQNTTMIDESVDYANCADVYMIDIYATQKPDSAIIYTAGGFIDAGNLQIHPPIN